MNKDIHEFIRKQKSATVCTTDEAGHPYCFSCFYAWDPEEGVIYYKTHGASRHAALMLKKSAVAGTVLPDKLNAIIVKGIQFEGTVLPPDHPASLHASTVYHARFPFALALPGVLWTIRIDHIKMTDSSKGPYSKIEWKRELAAELN